MVKRIQDLLDTVEASRNTSVGQKEVGLAACLRKSCDQKFRYRSNKKYCSDRCRKADNRPRRNSHESRSKAREQLELFDRALLLGELLYRHKTGLHFYKFGKLQDPRQDSLDGRPPLERLEFMEQLIQQARAGDAQIRDILSKPHMRRPDPYREPERYPFGNPQYSTIAGAAQAYCKRFWRANVWEVVHNKVATPPTGEVMEDGSVDDWPEKPSPPL
ncbi:hypothetical protein [Roseivivax sp. CAU 1753]